MAAVTVKKVSRLRFAELTTIEGYTFFAPTEMPFIDPAADDIQHTVTSSDRIDLLANTYYGTPDLWWVIARANGIRLLPRDLKLNARLLIPSRIRVFTKIIPLVR